MSNGAAFKTFSIILLTLEISIGLTAELRKTPKVYNAVISSDENLLASRAYPVIQPTLYENGQPFLSPYYPYRYFTQPIIRQVQPIVPGVPPTQTVSYPLPYMYVPSKFINKPMNMESENHQEAPKNENSSENKGQKNSNAGDGISNVQITSKPEYFLPSVHPYLPNVYRTNFPSNIPYHGYNLYPLMLDNFIKTRDSYLPPYDYVTKPTSIIPYTTEDSEKSQPPRTTSDSQINQKSSPSTNDIPNVSDISDPLKNTLIQKNPDIPDVAPPPIPTGAKTSKI